MKNEKPGQGGPGFLTAIVGTGPALPTVLELFDRREGPGTPAWFRLAGVVAAGPGMALERVAQRARIPVFSSCAELFEACPDVAVVIDLSTGDREARDLRDLVPPHVSVVDARLATALSAMLSAPGGVGAGKNVSFHSDTYLATIIDGLEEDILLLDRTGQVVDVNRTMHVRLGRKKEDIVGRHCGDLEGGHFCRRARSQCPFHETLATGRKAEAVHTRIDPDGRVQYFRVYTYPLCDEAGETTHVVELRRDITTRTFTEQRLQQAQKMAAIGELSTYIAHEIRNPLFAIGGFAQALMRRDDLAPDAGEKVGIILEEAKRLDVILRSILKYARPTEIRAGDVDVNLVAGETVQLMSIGCDPEGIHLATELDADIARAKGVPELLKQCLINMVKNSMEAMTGRGGTITVRTAMRDEMVLVQVRDEGVGISDEVKAKLFNPFFSTKDTGSGLGLAMTRKIVEEAGGTVELESEVGRGTVVTLLLLPALAVDGPALDEADRPA